ncbi:MAG: hypothetical protein M1835_007822 [Candelina submexicana]|nr:MAG: hypothetical protein M1835_007822 [Candelina submexicana]
MWCSNAVVLKVLLITFLASGYGAGSLVRRARSDGQGRPPVGPPTPAPQCDLRYGTPTRNDCDYAVDWINGMPAGDEDNMEIDQNAWDAYHRVYYAIVEFLNPQAERENRQRPAIRTPKFWRSGNCVVSVTVLQGLGNRQSDEAAWHDISTSSYEILEDCVDQHQRGGLQILGEHNNLAVEVYTADSEHGEEIAADLGHEIPAYSDEPTEPARPDYISDTEDEEADQDTVCFAGESAGWCLNASKCCSGHKFVLRKLVNAYQLLGMTASSAISIGTCS